MTFSSVLWGLGTVLTLWGLIAQCIKWIRFDPTQRNSNDEHIIERMYKHSDDFVQAQKRVRYFHNFNKFVKRDNIRMKIVHWFIYFSAVQVNSFTLSSWYDSLSASSEKTFIAVLPASLITYLVFYKVNDMFRKKLYARINRIFDEMLESI